MRTIGKAFLFFAGVTAAVWMTGCHPKPAAEKTTADPAAGPAAKKPDWLKGPMVAGGSNHEPWIFYQRRDGASPEKQKKYLYTHSQEFVDLLKERRATFYMTHAFKGFGLEIEKPEIELAREFVMRLHAKGIKAGTYIGSTLAYETFLLENPEAEKWLVPDYLGEPVIYGGTQYWRRRPYFAHPEYRAYIKKALRVALKDIQGDLIHFDNPANQAIPPVFHHPMAIQDFREYLKTKYTPQALKERIGFSDPSRVVPPAYPNPGSFQSFDDPVTQEWIDFRCQKLADYYKEMAAYIRALNPEAAVEINPHGITGANRAWESSVDFERLLPHVDVFVCEDGNPASLTAEGILVSNIRSYKLGKAFHTIVFNGVGSSPVAAAETMAFNPLSFHRPEAGLQNYVDFYHDHFEYYGQAEPVADVAILRSYPSMAYSNYSTHQSTVLFEQVLIQCKIPFDIIFDTHLKDLSKYSVLVLANQECLGDEQLERIREFVRRGGGLVATENSSLYDPWRRERDGFGLKDLLGVERPSSVLSRRVQTGGALESLEELETRQSGKTVFRQFEKGKVAYIPLIEPSRKRPPAAPMLNHYWKLPANYAEIADAVKAVSPEALSVEIQAPLPVTMELTAQEGRRMLHLINYDQEKEKLIKDIAVRLKIPEGKQIKEIQWLSPEMEGSESLPFSVRDQRVSFKVPRLAVYDLVVAAFH